MPRTLFLCGNYRTHWIYLFQKI